MFDLPPESEVKPDFPEVPADTEVIVKVRKDRNGDIAFRTGTSKRTNKPWMSVPFVIVGGEFDGRYASLMLTVDGNNKYFRRDMGVITGADISGGARISQEDFEQALETATFRVLAGSKGEFVNVTEMLERLPLAEGATPTVEAPAGDVDDEDIPF